MGWKLKSVNLNLDPNEEEDLCITLKPEERAAVHGIVKFPDGRPVENAVVKLFLKKSCHDNDHEHGHELELEHEHGHEFELEPVTFTFTDRHGQFLFGVDSCVDYVIEVFFYKPEKDWDKDHKQEDKHD